MASFHQHSRLAKILATCTFVLAALFVTNDQHLPSSLPSFRTSLVDMKRNNQISSHETTTELKRHLTVVNDIHVPRDMWRRASEVPSWNPPPLYRCCGRGRLRPDTWCKAAEDPLRYYGPGMGYTPEDMRRLLFLMDRDIIIIGDSTSSQWYRTLFCYLGGFESGLRYADSKLGVDIGRSFERARPNFPYNTIKRNFVDAFHIPRKNLNPSHVMKNSVIFHKARKLEDNVLPDIMDYFNNEYTRDFSRPKPIFVMNLGLHYNLEEIGTSKAERHMARFVQSDLKDHLKVLVTHCHKTDSQCIFRESSPQSFETEAGDGLWPGVEVAGQCMKDAPKSFGTLSRWRNDALYEAIDEGMKEVRPKDGYGGGYVRVMKVFDKLSGLDRNHHYTASDLNTLLNREDHLFDDCTHFTWDSNIWEPWHLSLTEVLEDLYDSNIVSVK